MKRPTLLCLSRASLGSDALRAELARNYEIVTVPELAAIPAQLASAPPAVVVLHLSAAQPWGESLAGLFLDLQTAFPAAKIAAHVDDGSPPREREVAARVADRCFSAADAPSAWTAWLQAENEIVAELARQVALYPHQVLHGRTRSLVTFTPALFAMVDELRVAARHDVTILLIGETGSGKTHLARLIHELSPRADGRITTVACGALPPDLIESELFGYVKGAFTGADRDRPGKFAAVGRGTLLLDEIDVLAPEQQAKLLRVIETGEYEPVGSNETQVSQARVIAASNVDLDELVATGQFRKDLYYRLNALKFHLLPLRERPLDIEFLARQFALDQAHGHGVRLRTLSPEVLSVLRAHAWPGNLRELENVMRRAVLYCQQGLLTAADLPSVLREPTTKAAPGASSTVSKPTSRTLESHVDDIEQRVIRESLSRHANRRQATAEELGISRVTLYHKMKKFGMLA